MVEVKQNFWDVRWGLSRKWFEIAEKVSFKNGMGMLVNEYKRSIVK